MVKTINAYIALGSNLNQPLVQVKNALAQIEKITQTQIVQVSPFYKNPPMGPQDQDDFVNAVVKINTTLDKKALLHALQAIEQAMGRVRLIRWGARIIDLDLLLYGNEAFQDSELTLPHPGVYERLFFLQPLHDIAPDLHLPDSKSVSELYQIAVRTKPELTAILDNGHG